MTRWSALAGKGSIGTNSESPAGVARPSKASHAKRHNNDLPPADPRPLVEQLIELIGLANQLGMLAAGNFVATAIGEMTKGQLSAAPSADPSRQIETWWHPGEPPTA